MVVRDNGQAMAVVEIKNATIRSARVGYERGAFLIPSLQIVGDGWTCGFGAYVCDKQGHLPTASSPSLTGFYIMRVLDTLCVESWNDLVGLPVRVVFEGGKIIKIGHFLKDQWFCPNEEIPVEIGRRKAGA